MKITATFAMLAWAILLHPSASALADDAKKIDCSGTDFKFDMPGYTAKCYDLSDATTLVGGETSGDKAWELYAYSDADETMIDVIDNRSLGNTSTYIVRVALNVDVDSYFSIIDKHWGPESTASGFTVAEFDGGPKNHQAAECIGFHRGVNRRGPGYARVVVGFACSTASRRKTYDLLTHLTAPGS